MPPSIARSLEIGKLTKRIGHFIAVQFEALCPDIELNHTQWLALESVGTGVGNTCASLALDVGHDVGATSRMLGLLEERGLVTRNRSTADRRVVILSLTNAGRDMVAICGNRLAKHWRMSLEDWSDEDLEFLIRFLDRLHISIADAPAALTTR